MPTLAHPLPDHLFWLTEKVEALVRPAAFLRSSPRNRKSCVPAQVADLGSTILEGQPDVPLGAIWASAEGRPLWAEHPSDGESFVAQINLAQVPPELRAQFPDLPREGVVWVTVDCSQRNGLYRARTYFDPRCSASIPWRARPAADGYGLSAAVTFELADTMTFASQDTLPEIAQDWREGGLAEDFDDWRDQHYAGRQLSDVQMGGWIHPIQGDCDQERKTLFMAFERRSFGDSGAVYLHHSAERGFFATAETH